MRKIFILFILFLLIFLSGCVEQGKYSYNVITEEELSLYPSSVPPGSTTTLSFSIKNNGDRSVERVRVEFYDLGGGAFTVENLECENGERMDNGCIFYELQSFESRKVRLVLKAPSLVVSRPVFKLKYSISYPFSGHKQILIPAIDLSKKSKPLTKLRESYPLYGPIQVKLELPVGTEKIEGKKTIRENWLFKGQKFSVFFKFEDVVNKDSGIVLPEGSVKLKLYGLTIDPDVPCDFENSGEFAISTKSLRVPGTLLCGFVVEDFEEGEISVRLEVIYNYTYRIDKAVEVSVVPVS